ncbi:hypothetical protein MTBSS4_190037 [Magnetospirillum sp. SS-4]|nr:hypothetical protein MTBSS4_190037 [Magnetospirillum sp. SS-4]
MADGAHRPLLDRRAGGQRRGHDDGKQAATAAATQHFDRRGLILAHAIVPSGDSPVRPRLAPRPGRGPAGQASIHPRRGGGKYHPDLRRANLSGRRTGPFGDSHPADQRFRPERLRRRRPEHVHQHRPDRPVRTSRPVAGGDGP